MLGALGCALVASCVRTQPAPASPTTAGDTGTDAPAFPCIPNLEPVVGAFVLPERLCIAPEPIADGCAAELDWWSEPGCPSYATFVRNTRPAPNPAYGGSGSWPSPGGEAFAVTRCVGVGADDGQPYTRVVFGHAVVDSGVETSAVFDGSGAMVRLERSPFSSFCYACICCGDETALAEAWGEPVHIDCTNGDSVGPLAFADSGDTGARR